MNKLVEVILIGMDPDLWDKQLDPAMYPLRIPTAEELKKMYADCEILKSESDQRKLRHLIWKLGDYMKEISTESRCKRIESWAFYSGEDRWEKARCHVKNAGHLDDGGYYNMAALREVEEGISCMGSLDAAYEFYKFNYHYNEDNKFTGYTVEKLEDPPKRLYNQHGRIELY